MGFFSAIKNGIGKGGFGNVVRKVADFGGDAVRKVAEFAAPITMGAAGIADMLGQEV